MVAAYQESGSRESGKGGCFDNASIWGLVLKLDRVHFCVVCDPTVHCARQVCFLLLFV